ncbi:MAG: hypothetical protein HPY73_00050 [Methanomassiliicoccales archaeon]|nr:MAG: hypothetical protein HPY73_00050 [Methanomassiliicoccales archaeon]
MAEDRNIHVKLAMADALGLLLIGWIAFMVGMFGLDQFDAGGLDAITAVSGVVGLGLIIVTIVAYLNENLLATVIFGVLGFFFLAFPMISSTGMPYEAGASAVGFIALALFIAGVVSLYQPVKLLPILLFIAAISFLLMALWWNEMDSSEGFDNNFRGLMGMGMTLVFMVATYMGAAILMMTIRGKAILPLLIK